MSRGGQIARQWRLLQVLEANRKGLTVGEIASHEDCSLRTIYRDLEALMEAGFPLYAEETQSPSEPQVWKFVDTYRLRFPLPFSFTELLSLYLACDLFKVLEGTVFHQAILEAFKKIEATLTVPMREFLAKVKGTFAATVGVSHNYKAQSVLIEKLCDAALRHVTCEIHYKPLSRQKAEGRLIDPYKIWFSQGTLYLIGYCHVRKDFRTFALDRMKKLEVTEKTFIPRQDFDFEAYSGKSLNVYRSKETFRLRLRFMNEAAGLVSERQYFRKQTLRALGNGSVELSAEVSGLKEILHWVLGFGANAEVLEPAELREEVLSHLQEASALYQKRLRKSA